MNHSNPTFIVYCGAMFGGKTTRMLSSLERFKHQKKNIMVFKPAKDDRYSDNDIVSHSGMRHPAITVKDGPDILQFLADSDISPDVVAVDEAFMIKGIADVLIWLYKSGISILVSTLDLSYSGKAFHEVEKILPWATTIEKCAAVCTECGRDAYYTHKKQIECDSEEIEVGGGELYESRCFRHHLAIDKRPKIHNNQ